MRDIWLNRALALLGGGSIGVYLISESILIKGLIFLTFSLTLFGLQLWRPKDFWGKVYKPEGILLVATLITGFLYGLSSANDLPKPLILEQIEIQGSIVDLKYNKDHLGAIIQVNDIGIDETAVGYTGFDILGRYKLNVYSDKYGDYPSPWSSLQPGDRIASQVRLEIVQSQGTQGGFDPQLYYYIQGLKGRVSLKGETEFLEKGKPHLTWLIRQRVSKQLNRIDPERAGIFEGILFGDTTNISAEVAEQYRAAGIWHVFAASGSNVAFVLGLSWILFMFFPKSLRVGLTISVLVFYALLCGGNAPIVRATVLGVTGLVGALGKGRLARTRLLLIAGAGMFLFKPLWLKDVGFQLSFAATWGIIVLMPHLMKLKVVTHLPSRLQQATALTMAAQLAVLPLLVIAFHRISIIGFATNVFILFILGAVLELGLIGTVLSPFSLTSLPFFQVGIWLIQFTDTILTFLVKLPFSDLWMVNPGVLFIFFWYGGLGVFLFGPKRFKFILAVMWRRTLRLFPQVGEKTLQMGERLSLKWVTLVLLTILLISPWRNQGNLRISFIDVGQGDAILIEGPKQQAILIDTGPAVNGYNAGEKVIIPYLLHKGIKSLEGLILTHVHEDHTGGAGVILDNIPVNWIGIPDTGTDLFEGGWAPILGSKVLQEGQINFLERGEKIVLDPDIVIDVIAPSKSNIRDESDANNNSVVLALHYGNMDVLLTGDMEKEGLEEILESGELQEDGYEVFKVPHHGSRYSLDEAFWDNLNSEMVIISVGKNSFGHPATEVLNYWEEQGIPIYRTDKQGTIELEIEPNAIQVKPGRMVYKK